MSKHRRTVNNNIFCARRRKSRAAKYVHFKLDADMGETQGEEKSPRIKPERQYSREELIELMTHPLSGVRPTCLDNPQNKCLVSGRSRWLDDPRKRTDSLTDEDGSADPQKKRINDPKAERLRKEQDVVLGPQRRSFNSGCFVNLAPQPRRPDSPTRDASHRELPARRIGSGRIMRDPVWDFRAAVDKEEHNLPTQNINNHDFNFRQRDDRYERRTYERSERGQQRGRYNNHNDRRKSEPEEPEWFSGGPTSQHDTIELHGFDGPIDEKTVHNKKQNKTNKTNNKNNRKNSESTKSEPVKNKSPSHRSSPEIIEHPRSSSSPVAEPEISIDSKLTNEDQGNPPQERNCVYNIEDILNFDSLPPLLTISNGCVEDGGGGSGSRFSQFFRRESPSPQQQQNSRHSSAHDEMFNSMINDITNISIPPDGDTYFAPISPAAATVKESSSLLEMLQRGGQGRKITKKPSLRDLEVSGKIHSVEELEARLRQDHKPSDHRPMTKEEEIAAFKKLMMNKQNQNMSEHKLPSHPGVDGLSGGGGGGFGGQQQQLPIPHDLVMKLLHVQQQQRQQQQEVFAKLLAPPPRLAPTMPPPLSPDLQMLINNSQPSKELLQRPEAQTILRSLKRGEITMMHLVEQLKRSNNMQPVHREMLACIIKLHSGVNQREPSPVLPPPVTEQLLHQMLHTQQSQQQQQQLRIPSPHANPFGPPPLVSPNLPPNSSNTLTIQHPHSVLQRVPSPRELVAHTQNILQNALLKKKLEEQKENYRKRQEMQRSHSPNVSMPGHTTSPTPLAFTPTSVLRKMTADNRDEHKEMSQQPPPLKQGRAIVKGNNLSVPPPDYMPIAPQFKPPPRSKQPPPQPHFMMGVNHLQPPSSRGVRGPGQGMPPAVHQLLLNHNNPRNTLLKPEAGRHGYYQDESQLARWFSPELLAQARAGKLPNMPPVSPTLSVEELERLQQAVHN